MGDVLAVVVEQGVGHRIHAPVIVTTRALAVSLADGRRGRDTEDFFHGFKKGRHDVENMRIGLLQDVAHRSLRECAEDNRFGAALCSRIDLLTDFLDLLYGIDEAQDPDIELDGRKLCEQAVTQALSGNRGTVRDEEDMVFHDQARAIVGRGAEKLRKAPETSPASC